MLEDAQPKSSAYKNPLDKDEQKDDTAQKIYTDEDREYLGFLQNRLQNGRDQKLAPMPEFNNRNYYQWFEENEKIANTYIEAKKNDDDVIIASGTVESKLNAMLSAIANLDLSPEIFAYDRNNNEINDLGVAIMDIMKEAEELDGADGAGDEEKKLLRQRELCKQGTVFVQDEWMTKHQMKKKLKEEYNGKFKGVKDFYTEELVKVFEGASRTLLYGPNVYQGNITEFYNENQPFLFVATYSDFNVVKQKLGKFENFQYVKPGDVQLVGGNDQRTMFDNKWRLNQVTENQCEVIIYEDEGRDEFQIIANGVLMLPIGFPLSAVSPGGKYNIVKQVLQPFHDKFAYGKPFVAMGGIKEVAALIDEMLKLFVLKTRKSITPAYINTSGRVIPKKVLSPGRITMGIPADALHAIGTEGQGVTNNEFSVLKELQDRIDKTTVSPQFQGQQNKSNTTATEIVELQKQAKLTLGLIVTACALLEKKLAYLRLYILLEHWFKPIDTQVDPMDAARTKIINKYRSTNRASNIDGKGDGRRMVIAQDGVLPDGDTIRALEKMKQKQEGYPVKIIYLNPTDMKKVKILWYIVINPKEKDSSTFMKLEFRDMLADITQVMNMGGQPNLDGVTSEFASVYRKPKDKFFKKATQPNPMMMQGGGGEGEPQMPGSPAGGGKPSLPGRANLPGAPAGVGMR